MHLNSLPSIKNEEARPISFPAYTDSNFKTKNDGYKYLESLNVDLTLDQVNILGIVLT